MLAPYLALPRQVHIVCLGTLVNRAGTMVVPFLTLYLTKKLGFDEAFATLCMGCFGLGAVVAAMIGGHAADAIGRKWVMVASLVGGAAMLMVFGTLSSKWSILGAVFLFAVMGEMYRPAASAMISDLVPPASRTHAFSLLYVSVNLGFAISPVIGGHLAAMSYHWLFWLDAGSAAAYAVIIAVFTRETLPSKQPVASAGLPRTEPAHPPMTAAQAAAHILGDYKFLAFGLGILLGGIVMMQCMATFPLHLSALGISEKQYGNIVAVNGAMIVLFQIPLTTLMGRFNRAWILPLSALITGAGFGMIGLGSTPSYFVMAVAVFTLGEMLMSPLIPAITSDFAPVQMRGRYMGVIGICYSGANAFGVPLGGLVLAKLGPGALWGGSFVLCTLAAMVFAAISPHTARRQAPMEPAAADDAAASDGLPTVEAAADSRSL
jgi:MFS family permease